MAHKEAAPAKKRKDASSLKAERGEPVKKARVGPLRRPFDREGPSSDSDGNEASDGDSGQDSKNKPTVSKRKELSRAPGQKADVAHKKPPTNGAANGKVFEKGQR